MNNLQRIHVFFTGHVQGVGYRNFVKQQATHLELTGWVKNLPDGRVESVIEGHIDKINILIQKCKRGHALAKINNIILTNEIYTSEFLDFKIRY